MSASPALEPPAPPSLGSGTGTAPSPSEGKPSLQSSSRPPVDIQALRAAALKSASSKRARSRTGFPKASPVPGPNATFQNNAVAGPSRIPIGTSGVENREEGEIGSDDDPRTSQPSKTASGPVDRPRTRKLSNASPSSNGKLSKKQRRISGANDKADTSPPVATLRQDVKGKGKATETWIETPRVTAAGTNMSTSEAEQYMDIIRNLIFEGFSPEMLVQRGATQKYVTQVCEEIVKDTKKRKALWLDNREQPRADSETPSNAPVSTASQGQTPNSDVEVGAGSSSALWMQRAQSTASEDSAELILTERSTPPYDRPLHLTPSPSWIPPTTVSSPSLPRMPQPVMVESYKPGQLSSIPAARPAAFPVMSVLPTKPLVSEPPQNSALTTTTSSRMTNGPAAKRGSGPAAPRQGRRRPGKQWDGGLSTGSDIVLNYGDEAEDETSAPSVSASASAAQTKVPRDTKSTVSVQSDSGPSLLPSQSAFVAHGPTTAELELKNALLEGRRKVLESMQRRRKQPDPAPFIVSKPSPRPTSSATSDLTPMQGKALAQTIEDQMADIEKEVLRLQGMEVEEHSEQESEQEMDMEIDEPEEGEIVVTGSPANTPVVDPPSDSLSLLPSRPSRGVKRLAAEDMMENQAITAPSRQFPKAKRRLFGVVQRPQRLILHLDDSSDSSDDEETYIPPPPDPDILATQRLLAEKEEGIRRLKEQITARMKARISKRSTESGETTPPVIDTQGSSVASPGSVPADVEQLSRELVNTQAEVEAMDVNGTAGNLKPPASSLGEYGSNTATKEPTLKVCSAEVGGGTCADRACQDLHLSRGLIPTDEDLAEYILQAGSGYTNLPKPKQSIEKALRLAKGELGPSSKSGQDVTNLSSNDQIQEVFRKVSRLLGR
ncbi:hypothetical protein IAU60_000441 [Kwoniella sp. DSM 27419]